MCFCRSLERVDKFFLAHEVVGKSSVLSPLINKQTSRVRCGVHALSRSLNALNGAPSEHEVVGDPP